MVVGDLVAFPFLEGVGDLVVSPSQEVEAADSYQVEEEEGASPCLQY